MTIFTKTWYFLSFFFLQFFCARVVLYWLHYEAFQTLSLSLVVEAFIQGIRFDTAVIFTFLGLPLLLFTIPIRTLQNKPIRNCISWILFLLFLVSSCILVGNLTYFFYVKRHMTNELLFVFPMLKPDINKRTSFVGGLGA